MQKEDLVKKNEELKHESELMKKRLDNIDGVNNTFIEKYEASKKKVQVLINSLFVNLTQFQSNKKNTLINCWKQLRISKATIKKPLLMSTF